MAKYGGSAAAMVDIVDKNTMKPNETSLGGNNAGVAAGASWGWRLAHRKLSNLRSSSVKIKKCTRQISIPFYGIEKMRCILRRI